MLVLGVITVACVGIALSDNSSSEIQSHSIEYTDIPMPSENVVEEPIEQSEFQVPPIEYTDISWSWSISNRELFNIMWHDKELDMEIFSGTITYTDGSKETIKPDSVELARKEGEPYIMIVSISFKGTTLDYSIEIHESWEDGEWLTGNIPMPNEGVTTYESEEPTQVTENEEIKLIPEEDLVRVVVDEFNHGKYDLLYNDLSAYRVEGEITINENIDYGVRIDSDNIRKLITLIYEGTGCTSHVVLEEHFAIFEDDEFDYSAYIELSDGSKYSLYLIGDRCYSLKSEG